MTLLLAGFVLITFGSAVWQQVIGGSLLPPEAIIVALGVATGFIVKAMREGFSPREGLLPFLAIVVGVLLAVLAYVGGLVDAHGTVAQMLARAVLAGLSVAQAASGGQSWVQQAQKSGVLPGRPPSD